MALQKEKFVIKFAVFIKKLKVIQIVMKLALITQWLET
jgi:hypothetical protein